MRILFTGSSSFTGFHFIKMLAKAGHEIIAFFSSREADYRDIRKLRVDKVKQVAECIFECPLGSEKFISMINELNGVDIFCYHYSFTENYRSSSFEISKALEKNTKNIDSIFNELSKKGCLKIIYTGSIFEPNEGIGDNPDVPFSLYGISKYTTYEIIRHFALKYNLDVGKFVIPNPFGPYEEKRFVYYLMKCWFNNETPTIKTPMYVRDNVHISLLSLAYKDFLESERSSKFYKINPSGYVETIENFTRRLSKEMRNRLGLKCDFILKKQMDFGEPIVMINKDNLHIRYPQWDETKAWDDVANYYIQLKNKGLL